MAEFGQKEVSAPQKAKSPEERKKKIIIIALIVLGVLAVLFGVKKIAVANKAVKAIRSEYLVTSGVEGVYIEHYTLYESMASRIKEHGLPIAPVFVIGS